MVTTRSGQTGHAPAKEPAKKKQKLQANNRGDSEKKTTKSQQESPKNQNHQKAAAKSTTSPSPQATAKSSSGNDQNTSHVLERGILYFFIRGRVNIDKPQAVDQIARSYLILRPIPPDDKLDGPLPAPLTSRIIALPKKTLPSGPRDRFMAFVEKADSSYDTLRDSFLKGDDYETKTAGHRHTPDATPVGEGVYALTSTGRESHLSYVATLPSKPGELQSALGFNERGTFIVSSKNPSYEGPENARLPKGPDYPAEVLEKFRDLRWVGARPEFLDYARAQILLIGQGTGKGKAKGKGDEKQEEEEQGEDVLGELGRQDVDRMQHLAGDESDAIYADLQNRKMEHPGVQKDM